MLPEFIMNRIDLIAEALTEAKGAVGAEAIAAAAKGVISSAATRICCADMLVLYAAALGTEGIRRTPICPAGLLELP